AGGKSSRMGEDKSLLPFGGFDTLTEFQLHRLSKLFTHVYISTKTKQKFNFDASFIEDIPSPFDTYAPTSGFVATFESMACEKFFALSVDAPFIDEVIIRRLIEEDAAQQDIDATIAKSNHGMEPMCGIYHRSLAPAFKKMLEEDNHKLGMLLKQSHTHFVIFPTSEPFLNLNHPEEYQQALKLLKTYQ
ncbi:MAG: molybdenum cofactor guanylyltransferase MobA, partial [Sulfurimonadaceae bacterium]|nr:molybdenum cofactor guanylyltransferase MobA [Sulfurimonadaceae bacterium]